MLELIFLLIGLVCACIWIFNKLVADRNQMRSAWSDIDVQLKRRHDLIPQLLATVSAYAEYEKAALLAVTELRTRSELAQHLPEKAALEDKLQMNIQSLVAVAENYPDLKADQNFRQLQTELTEIENHIQYARRFYNGAVRILNTRIQSFPHFVVARPFGFKVAEFFQIDNAAERQTVGVKLD